MSTDKEKIETGITGRGLGTHAQRKRVFSLMCAPSPLVRAMRTARVCTLPALCAAGRTRKRSGANAGRASSGSRTAAQRRRCRRSGARFSANCKSSSTRSRRNSGRCGATCRVWRGTERSLACGPPSRARWMEKAVVRAERSPGRARGPARGSPPPFGRIASYTTVWSDLGRL